MQDKQYQDKQYFATKPAQECAEAVIDYKDDYYSFVLESGLLQTWRKAFDLKFRGILCNGMVGRAGDQGERLVLSVNHYRNILQHLKVMLLQQRPTFEPRATNTDYESMGQTILAKGLLDYYMREKDLEKRVSETADYCLDYGEGFILLDWDATAGKAVEIDPSTGKPVHEGDLRYQTFIPMNVIRDVSKTTPKFDQWVTVRTFRNKYDLMQKYPDLADRIADVQCIDNLDVNEVLVQTAARNVPDDVPVYTFYHAKTDALPEGRLLTFLDTQDKIILSDGPLPFPEIPLYRMAPGELQETVFGYTVGYDLMPLQDSINTLYSCVLTNQSAFGTQSIMVPKGNDLSVMNMDGMAMIEFDATLGPPQPLNLTNTPAEIFNFIQTLQGQMETISGINSVVRGNPEQALGADPSGAALALIQSTAISFSQQLSMSFAKLLEDVGTGTLQILKEFAKSPRIAGIVGKQKQYLMETFTGDDLSGISRVTVDLGNPLTRTTAGKVKLAETFMERGLIRNPDQYLQVLETGRLEPVLDGVQAELMNISLENEELSGGRPVRALLTDNHQQHILEHKTVVATPEARRNPQVIETTLAHIQEHIDLWMQMPPPLAVATNQAAPPMPMMPSAAGPMNPETPITQEAGAVNLPSPPKIAGTNEPAELAPGTAIQP